VRIYIAGPWDERDKAREVRNLLRAAGHTVTHAWWDIDVPDQDPVKLRDCAVDDLRGVLEADVFILLNLSKSEGKAVETGIALVAHRAHGLPLIYATGIRNTNIFHYLPEIEWRDSVEQIIEELS